MSLKKYTPSFDFSDFQASNPDTPLPGWRLDGELAAIQDALDGLTLHASGRAPAAGPDAFFRVSQDPSLFEAAGGLGPDEWESRTGGLVRGKEHRLGVFQGIPPGGPAPNPTMVDYGHGELPTYVRFEMRDGPAPTKDLAQSPEFDVFAIGESFDDELYYPDPEQIRVSSLRDGDLTDSDIRNPADNQQYFYEASFWLSPLFPTKHLTENAPRGQSVLLQTPVTTDGATTWSNQVRMPVGGGEDQFGVITSAVRETDGSEFTDNYLYFEPTRDWVGRWITVRLVTEFTPSGTNSGSLEINGIQVRNWSGKRTLPNNTKPFDSNKIRYGLEIIGVGGMGSTDFYIPGKRETVVIFTGVRWGTV